jgi:pSer/pThr/pTyr-binding forkhead associated (FHA) protein
MTSDPGTGVMPILRFTVRVTDHRAGNTLVRSFFRSPVTVGRQEGNALRLDSTKVSSYHGAFAFGRGSLRYVDYGSRNGTSVDGNRIPADLPVEVDHESILRIGPFLITVQLQDIFPNRPFPGETETPTPSGGRPPTNGMTAIAAILATYTERDALHEIIGRWPLSALLARALLVLEVLAEVIVEFRPDSLVSNRSPLRGAKAAEGVIVYLLDPAGGDESLEEILTYLVEMIHPGILGDPGEGRS